MDRRAALLDKERDHGNVARQGTCRYERGRSMLRLTDAASPDVRPTPVVFVTAQTFAAGFTSHWCMCGEIRLVTIFVAGCTVPGVSSVPGFAQSNTASHHASAAERSAAGAMRVYVDSRAAFVASATLPPNLMVPRGYLGLLESMLKGSATFQRQCLRIAQDPDLLVRLEANLSPRPGDIRAKTQITRQGRKRLAVIQVLQLDDPAELVAHELEHIIEQLDGIDLPARAALDGSGVRRRRGDPPLFETTRATQVGRTVARELRGGG